MCSTFELHSAYRKFQDELVRAGLLIPSGVAGVYGLSGDFEDAVERIDRLIARAGAHLRPEVVRFPPLLSRQTYQQTDHLESFPNLMGSVHSFHGTELDHQDLLRRKDAGEDWSGALQATDLMMTPAACYPLYPAAKGILPPGGRTVDLRAFVFRREPSPDPARMQIFRQHEFVRLGTSEEALAHRDYWLVEAERLLRILGLEPVAVVANDPFFGRGGRVMVASQREQALKYELVVPIAAPEKPTAVVSTNYHRDHFGLGFGIRSADGNIAHTACVGFGLERIALALFKKHGLEQDRWPGPVRDALAQ